MLSVLTISVGDNYVYLCEMPTRQAFVVDPSDAKQVASVLDQQHLGLTHILITHHHFDHTSGVAALRKKYGCEVVTGEKANVRIGDISIEVIPTPGHTADSVCYYLPAESTKTEPIVFTGDTLFVASCGRLIECDAETMWRSLQKLAALPDETLVYVGHNYTQDNLEFVLSIEPDNKDVSRALEEVHLLQREGKPTVPSSISREKKINPFLRAGDSQVFADLRRRKNLWG